MVLPPLLNIHCGYTLEPPHRGVSNEYSQCMFWNKNEKIRYTPVKVFTVILFMFVV